MTIRFLTGVMVLVAARVAAAGPIDGHVYVDADGDGVFSAGDLAIAGAQVAYETTRFAITDADGAYTLDAPDLAGIVWVRPPDGYEPGPSWSAVDAAGGTFDLALREARAGELGTFVIGSDLHVGKEVVGRSAELDTQDGLASLAQATAFVEPRFIVLTGDLVQSNRPEQYEMLLAVRDALDVPMVPVPGNHDWYDGGASYRLAMGPPMYSFDADGVRFLVLNDNATVSSWTAFLGHELADWPVTQPAVAFTHQPPPDNELAIHEAAGVDYLFTGHWHANLEFEYGDLIHLNTEPLIRGGVDGTPAGYRVITLRDGLIDSSHQVVIDRDLVELVSPAPNQCVDRDELDVIVATATLRPPVGVEVELDGRVVALSPLGGWNWGAEIDLAGARPVSAILRVDTGDAIVTSEAALAACSCDATGAAGEWSQAQGGPSHTNAGTSTISPPLRTTWVAALGEHPSGPPIVSDGRVFVSVADLDRGEAGGVVAFDLETGEELWRFLPGVDVRNSVAVAEGVVVVPGADGRVHAVDAATGAELWLRDLGEGLPSITRVSHAAPTIVDGVVYVGVHRNFEALDLATGDTIWQGDPAPDGWTETTRAAAAIADGLVIGTAARGRGGMFAWETASGAERWRLSPDDSTGVHASPVVDGQTVYVVNAAGEVLAVDLETGEERWRTQILDDGNSWDYAVLATPVLADGLLIVPMMYDDLVALDTADGSEVWRHATTESVLHDAHGRATASSFPSSPVFDGDVIWVAAGDGRLEALDPASGETQWTVDLGVPGNGGLAAAGEVLVVVTFDGTVRAMVSDPCIGEFVHQPPPGCGCATSHPTGWLVLTALVALGLARRRRLPAAAWRR